MKKLILLAIIVAGCRGGGGGSPGTTLTGAVTPRRAVEDFLRAVKAQDLQAMSVVWGTAKGPARDQLDRTELEKREIIMQSCYDHDRYQVLDESPGTGGQRVIKVSITRGNRTRSPSFTMVKGPSDRWYVLDADINSVREFCRS